MNLAEGTSAGAVYFDLVVRDTLDKQISSLMEKASAILDRKFPDLEKKITSSMEASMERAAKAMEQPMEKANKKVQDTFSRTVEEVSRAGTAVDGTFNKSVEMAKINVQAMEAEFERLENLRKDAVKVSDSEKNDQVAEKIAQQVERAYNRLETARARLQVQIEAAAQKQASAEEAANQKMEAARLRAEEAAKRSAEREAAAFERAKAREELAAQKAADREAAEAERAAAKKAEEERKAAEEAKKAHEKAAKESAKKWKTFFKRFGSGFGKLGSILASPFKRAFGAVEKQTNRFHSRLGSIASGALIFNGISAGLRNLTNYLSSAVMQTDAMKGAMSNLKGAAATAAAPIIQMLTPALSALANGAATVFAYLSRLISFFTGKSVSAMANAAKGMSKAGGAAGGAAKQMEKANRQLASFDELNQLQDQSGGDSGGGGGGAGELTPNFDFAPAENTFLEQFTESIKQKDFSGAAKVLTGKLNSMVAGVDWHGIGAKAGSFLDGALLFLATVITTFDWLGLGGSLAHGVNGILDSVDWGNLGTVLSGKFYAILLTAAGFLMELDWGALADGFSRFAIGFFDGITNALTEVDWQELGGKVGTFLCEIDWGSVAISAFTALGAAFGAAAGFLYGLLIESLRKIGDMFSEKIDKWTDYMGGNIAGGILFGIIEGLGDIGKWIWDHIFKPFIDGFCEAFGIHSPSKVMEEKGIFLIEGLFQGITTRWNEVKSFFSRALADVERVFADTWNHVRTTAGNIWSGIVATIKGAVNGIIGAVNGMIRGIVNGINTATRALNSLSFSIPSWIPGVGGMSLGFNLPSISAPQIPYLADGAVIPPNDEFIGVLGDQKHGTNIEAPLDTIKQALAEVLAELHMDDELSRNNELLSEIIEILRQILAKCGFSIDGRSFARYMRSQLRELDRMGCV